MLPRSARAGNTDPACWRPRKADDRALVPKVGFLPRAASVMHLPPLASSPLRCAEVSCSLFPTERRPGRASTARPGLWSSIRGQFQSTAPCRFDNVVPIIRAVEPSSAFPPGPGQPGFTRPSGEASNGRGLRARRGWDLIRTLPCRRSAASRFPCPAPSDRRSGANAPGDRGAAARSCHHRRRDRGNR